MGKTTSVVDMLGLLVACSVSGKLSDRFMVVLSELSYDNRVLLTGGVQKV